MIDPNTYSQQCFEKANEYVESVQSGRIIANKWIKLAVEKHLDDSCNEDLIYESFKVDKVFKFFSFININKNNRYQQIELLPWQCFIIATLFGFYWKPTGKRKYRTFLLMIARKNGKTSFSSALQLYGLIADGVQDAQSLLIANSREQASIALGYLTGMVLYSPSLDKRLYPQRNRIISKDYKNLSYAKTLSSQAHRLDGYSANFALLDECHEMPDDSLYNVIKSSTLARDNPLICLISTAGFSMDTFFYEFVETSKTILKKEIEEESIFPMIYTLDDGDDPKDSSLWIKSNPSLGELLHFEDLEIEFNASKNSSSTMNNFLTKHLDVFTASTMDWIDDEQLRKVIGIVDEKDLHGLECYAGIDLSSTTDMTSIVLVFYHEDKFKVLPYYFSTNKTKDLRKGGYSINKWIDGGHIIPSNQETIDYDLIYDKIIDLSEKFQFRLLNYDKFNSALLIPRLQERGIYCEPFAQTCMNFNAPMKYLEKLIYDEMICLGSNPTLIWNFRNAVIYADGNGNIKALKNKSKDQIDGLVSLAMGVGAYLRMNKFDYDKNI